MSKPDAAYVHVWAVPGKGSIIDEIDPVTGLTRCMGRDAADVLAQAPTAVRMTWQAWQAAAVERQQTPIVWLATDRAMYDEMLNVLPPAVHTGEAYLVGEPMDHDVATGRPRFAAFIAANARYYTASRPLTVAEFRAQLAGNTGKTVNSGESI